MINYFASNEAQAAVMIDFVDGKTQEAMCRHAYHRGRLSMCGDIVNYDTGIQEQQQQANPQPIQE